jgi:hypothetical protein
MMPELAWLNFLKGEWLLVTSDNERNMRKWVDRELALRELEEEGWTITAPASRDPGCARNLHRRLLGYRLMRTVH